MPSFLTNAVPHQVTLIAWGMDGENRTLLDIVETSWEHESFFIEQFRGYEGIYGYSCIDPFVPYDAHKQSDGFPITTRLETR